MSIRADRTLPLSFHHELQSAGVEVVYDPDLGVAERRSKDDQEIAALARAQADTEAIVRRVCEIIAEAKPNGDGVLRWSESGTLGDGETGDLTSERLRRYIDVQLLRLGYDNPHGSIVAGGSEGGDCHNRGAGAIRTGEPVIIDIFPRSKETLYHGDCTRTVVNGQAPPRVREMHAAVVEAKTAATAAVAVGATGEAVHRAAMAVMASHSFPMGLPPENAPTSFVSMPHGTGHGLGLDVHEPPLLDTGGPPLVAGDALTIEPGLYGPTIGGVRIEDLVVVTTDGALSLSSLPEGLDWA
jgi:Xaa-Pro aminopeptidase